MLWKVAVGSLVKVIVVVFFPRFSAENHELQRKNAVHLKYNAPVVTSMQKELGLKPTLNLEAKQLWTGKPCMSVSTWNPKHKSWTMLTLKKLEEVSSTSIWIRTEDA